MTIENARTASNLVKRIDGLQKQLRNIENQKDYIGKNKEMIINSKDDNGGCLSSTVIDSTGCKKNFTIYS